VYASNLERLLFDLVEQSDASRSEPSDMAKRFDSLRRYGRLPQGRENHAALLTDEQIASAIFGLASNRPGWAGQVAIVLGNLVPVGGRSASISGSETLVQAVKLILSDKAVRKDLVSLTISSAVSGTNSNGHATIKARTAEGDYTVSFVSQLALSLLERGAEKNYDHSYQYAKAARFLTLNGRFFERLVQQSEFIRKHKPKPISDGSEYDAGEVEKRRLQKLGVRNDSRYLTIGVDNQVTWPIEETLVNFDRFTLVLLPKTKEHVQSINIDLTANKLSMSEARTVMNRFLSLMTLCDDQFAVAQDGWAGSPVPSPVSRRDLAFTTTYYWLFDRKISSDNDTLRALALYREARNAEQNYLVSYAVLNYYKIIEIRHPKGSQARARLAAAFPIVEPKIRVEVLREFHKELGANPPEKHIYEAYRVAVAHASTRTKSDPDSSNEITRLHIAAEILRELARHFISTELKVSDSLYSGD
jgi:hypothetical protein